MRVHYIYLTTNLINNKKYIGQRLVPKNMKIEKDKYLGSGMILLSAVEKHGCDNFKKEILEICYSRINADKLEQFYFNKFKVLEKKEEFYNRGHAGQFWRDKRHSEFMSKKMKDFYSNDENYKKRHGVTRSEYNKKKDKEKLDKENKKNQKEKKNIEKRLEKEKYNYQRKLTKDLRKELYNAKSSEIQKKIWSEKKKDPEFLKAVEKGKKNIDYKQLSKKNKIKISKGNAKTKSIIYEKLWENNLSKNQLNRVGVFDRYLLKKYKSIESLKNAIETMLFVLVYENGIKLSYEDLMQEAKIKYSHLYE